MYESNHLWDSAFGLPGGIAIAGIIGSNGSRPRTVVFLLLDRATLVLLFGFCFLFRLILFLKSRILALPIDIPSIAPSNVILASSALHVSATANHYTLVEDDCQFASLLQETASSSHHALCNTISRIISTHNQAQGKGSSKISLKLTDQADRAVELVHGHL